MGDRIRGREAIGFVSVEQIELTPPRFRPEETAPRRVGILFPMGNTNAICAFTDFELHRFLLLSQQIVLQYYYVTRARPNRPSRTDGPYARLIEIPKIVSLAINAILHGQQSFCIRESQR